MNEAQDAIRKELKRLLERSEELEEQIEKLETERGDVIGQIRHLHEYLKKAGVSATFIALGARAIDPSFTNLSKTKAVRRLLYRNRRMTVDELYTAMMKRGYRFRGRRPTRDLTSALRTSPHFGQDEDKRWYLVDPDKEW